MFAKMAVFGAGAIGSTLGGYLRRAGADVTLIDMWSAHVEQMRTHGLTVTTTDDEFTVPVKAVHLADVSNIRESFDVVFFALKSYDSDWGVRCIAPLLKPAGVLVCAQNGINEDVLAATVGYTRLIGCVVTFGAALQGPGHVTRTSASTLPSLTLGELNGMVTRRLQEMVKLLGVLGPIRATTNLWGERWAKLIVNSMSNPIAGITGLGSADLRARPEVLSIFVRVACEALRLTEALGVNVEAIGGIPAATYLEAGRGIGLQALHAKLIEGGRNLGAGRPSLLQDVLKGRRTEVQYLNGYMVRKGKELGIPTPMNEAIVRAVEAVESGALKPDPGNLETLELTSAAARPVG
jgi:2-dehydropantoate 2-reductase